MNATDFLRYLKQPRLLMGLSLAELQQLALRFPYSTNLRRLLLLKSRLADHPDEAAYLSRCAAASFDRASVYDALRELDVLAAEQAAPDEEVLELRELDDLILNTEPVKNPEPLRLVEDLPSPSGTEEFISGWEAEELISGKTAGEITLAEEPNHEEPPVENLTAEVSDPGDELPSLISADDVMVPHTQVGYGSLQERLARIRQRNQSKEKGSKEDVNRIARRSLVAQEEVASETLAKLLIRQGQYQHAIKMYQRLILLYPEKKPTFAGLIQELKEKL